jgi:signal peptidase I
MPIPPTVKPAPLPRSKRALKTAKNWAVSFATAFAILAPLRSAVADWNDVPTGSMEPTILCGDRILVNKLAFGLRVPFTHTWLAQWSDPAPGEIVVLNSPKDGTRLVKRVVAGPGDTVALRHNTLFLNGQEQAYSLFPDSKLREIPDDVRAGRQFASEHLRGHTHAVAAIPSIPTAMRDFGPVIVPQGQYFVMGDNRDNSADSRYFGFVKRELIVGRSSAVAISVDPKYCYLPRFGRWFSGLD